MWLPWQPAEGDLQTDGPANAALPAGLLLLLGSRWGQHLMGGAGDACGLCVPHCVVVFLTQRWCWHRSRWWTRHWLRAPLVSPSTSYRLV